MEDHDTRRKIIREWMALTKEKRQTEEQVAAFAKKAARDARYAARKSRPKRRQVRPLHGT